jgi:hypothetical protein
MGSSASFAVTKCRGSHSDRTAYPEFLNVDLRASLEVELSGES